MVLEQLHYEHYEIEYYFFLSPKRTKNGFSMPRQSIKAEGRIKAISNKISKKKQTFSFAFVSGS